MIGFIAKQFNYKLSIKEILTQMHNGTRKYHRLYTFLRPGLVLAIPVVGVDDTLTFKPRLRPHQPEVDAGRYNYG